MQRGFLQKARLILLLAVLIFVALGAWLTKLRSTDWDQALWVVVYPINGDQQPSTARYIDNLTAERFLPIARFMAREGRRYQLELAEPVSVKLAPPLAAVPPMPPPDKGVVGTMWWSLKLRYWAYRNNNFDGPSPDIQVFVLYYDPASQAELPHSLGLEKGLIGVVHAYASRRYSGRNQVVIAHEILHTLGATDKYDLSTNLPLYPDGYADPDRQPRYPQRHAEIMGGRIPISSSRADIPSSLRSATIGPKTAQEINWPAGVIDP